MASKVIGSQLISDTADAVQLFSVASPRVFAITVKARAGNAGQVYIADDSAAKSAGFELRAGDAEDKVFHPTSVQATNLWVWGTSSGDRLDYWALMED